MGELTLAQKKMLAGIGYGISVYVFLNGDGVHTFSYHKDSTCARIYTTLTVRPLIDKGLVKVKLCEVDTSLDNCVGVLEVVDVTII